MRASPDISPRDSNHLDQQPHAQPNKHTAQPNMRKLCALLHVPPAFASFLVRDATLPWPLGTIWVSLDLVRPAVAVCFFLTANPVCRCLVCIMWLITNCATRLEITRVQQCVAGF
jgi:hypothetical protein